MATITQLTSRKGIIGKDQLTSTGDFDLIQRTRFDDVKISFDINADYGDYTATIVVYTGVTTSPTTPACTITLNSLSKAEDITISNKDEYILATVTAFYGAGGRIDMVAESL